MPSANLNQDLAQPIVISTRDKIIVSGILLSLLLLWCLSGWDGLTTRRERAESRASIRAIFEDLELGQAKDAVEALVARYPNLHVRSDEESLEADTPIEFGAKNWILTLQFQEGVLVEGRIRTRDSAFYHPPDAPADLVSERL